MNEATKPVELPAQRMVLVRPDLFEKCEGGRRNSLQQNLVCAIELEKRRKLGADFLADRVERDRIG
jgi:hypothetical protein